MHGNGVTTAYEYDPLTFRLIHLQTIKGSEALQDLFYTYDPAGNITHIRDDAQQTIYFRNQVVDANNDYTYDAIYQLIEATGREHLGQLGSAPTAPDALNEFHTGLDHPGDGNAMGSYLESYIYDAVGNILSMQHRGSDPSHPGWTRAYSYHEGSQVEATKTNNRLSSTHVGNGPVESYSYDAHGSMTMMPHLSLMRWNYLNQLEASARQVVNSGTPETTYYLYDAGGQRVRKVTERQAEVGQTPTPMHERIYLGTFEIYREYGAGGSAVNLERVTLHVADGQQRIALVETRTQGDDGSALQLLRYQLGNHLGSASLEIDETGAIVSYEEYYPYGSTSFQAMNVSTKAAAKRYRYTAKERDEETGLSYHGARYYSPWLGRWVSPDPLGLVDGVNLYSYVKNSPLIYLDQSGNETRTFEMFVRAPDERLAQAPGKLDLSLGGGYSRWLGEGLYGGSSPDIPNSVATGKTLVSLQVTGNVVDVTDSPYGQGYIQATRQGTTTNAGILGVLGRGSKETLKREVTRVLNQDPLTRNADVLLIRDVTGNGVDHFVVRNASVLPEAGKVVGTYDDAGQFIARKAAQLPLGDLPAGAKKSFGFLPILPFIISYASPDQDFSESEGDSFVWALMGEVGGGAFDLQFAYESIRGGLALDAIATRENSPTEAYRQMMAEQQRSHTRVETPSVFDSTWQHIITNMVDSRVYVPEEPGICLPE